MTDDSTIGSRLRELMAAAQISENELARRAEVPQPTVHRILKGTSKSPKISSLEKIAMTLGTSTGYLAYGDSSHRTQIGLKEIKALMGNPTAISSKTCPTDLSISNVYNYPLLEWSEAATSSSIFTAALEEKKLRNSSDYKVKEVCFWLCLKGDAMSAPPGVSPSLPDSTQVLFDTGMEITVGKLVLAQLPNTPLPTFRRLVEDTGHRYLQPLNPSYPLIRLEKNCSILAVAIEAKVIL
ncbi:helix-turn-helix domain-containing protein [Kushneria sp. EE4]